MIKVLFPDGSVRHVPSRTRVVSNKQIGGPQSPTLVEEPLYDARWGFYPVIGGWRAQQRSSFFGR